MANFKIFQEINNIKDGTITVGNSEKVGGKTASGSLSTTEKTNLVTAINQCFQSASDGKTAIVAALVAMGVSASTSENFSSLAAKIRTIQTGIDTGDATATAANILAGMTAYARGTKLTGTIPSKAAATITPGTTNQTIAAGQYLSGTQTIVGDADLATGNIRSGANIFGINGKQSVVETYDATMTANDLVSGKTGYANGVKLSGALLKSKTITFTNPDILLFYINDLCSSTTNDVEMNVKSKAIVLNTYFESATGKYVCIFKVEGINGAQPLCNFTNCTGNKLNIGLEEKIVQIYFTANQNPSIDL